MAFIKGRKGLGGVSVKGFEYQPDENGLIHIPDDCVELLIPHGYVQCEPESSKPVEKQEVAEKPKKSK